MKKTAPSKHILLPRHSNCFKTYSFLNDAGESQADGGRLRLPKAAFSSEFTQHHLYLETSYPLGNILQVLSGHQPLHPASWHSRTGDSAAFTISHVQHPNVPSLLQTPHMRLCQHLTTAGFSKKIKPNPQNGNTSSWQDACT